MKKTAVLIVLSLFCHFGAPAYAIWMRSESVEWWTNISDIVAEVKVSSTREVEPLNEHWQSQQVRFTTTAILKGQHADSFSVRQDYQEKTGKHSKDAPLRSGQKVLLFCVSDQMTRETEIVFWVNITKPDAKFSAHSPYNNECAWLKEGDSILDLVKGRIAKEEPLNRKKRRGVIINFTAGETGDMHWDFVRTADPEYKSVLIKQLRDGDESSKESAIYNLISYPGQETRDLIRPFLKDPSVSDLEIYGRSGGHKTVKIYNLRQAAYSALKLLGESVQKPEGYCPDPSLWLFKVGFEDEAYFPYGDWKRAEE